MADETNTEILDIIVIGAGKSSITTPTLLALINICPGLYGIAAARTYLDVHPECSLVWLDQDSSVGGSWNES